MNARNAAVIDTGIVDVNGNPLRASMAIDTPHDAASTINSEVGGWHPTYLSADGELLGDRQKILARTQDLIRNNGLASGAVQTHLDWIIGSGLQLNAKPDWYSLGVKDREAAAEWERKTEAKWRNYSEDPYCYIDASRGMRFSELLAQAYRSYLTAFEIVQAVEWLPNRGSIYGTAIQSIDPMRVSNPRGQSNTTTLRDGIQLDQNGVPLGGWVCNRIPGDGVSFQDYQFEDWQFVPHENLWGRPRLMHVYDRERPAQSRGKNTGFIAALTKTKMHEKHGQAALQSAVLNAMYAAVIESSLSQQEVGSALGTLGATGQTDPRTTYMAGVTKFHKENTIRFGGSRVTHLFPDEKLTFQAPVTMTPAFEQFERSVLRYMAAGFNMPYEQLSRDYSQTNYTGFRAAMLTAWQFFAGRQHFIGGRLASMIYCAWLEEAMMKGEIELLPGTPDFQDARVAWCRCEWIGPGRGTLDPLRESEATSLDLDMGLTTMEIEASQRGRRWEELMEQTAQEMQYRRKLEREFGLPEGALDRVGKAVNGAKDTQASDGTPEGHPDNPKKTTVPAPEPAKEK